MRLIAFMAAALAASGCAMSPERFSQTRFSLNDTEVCRSARDANASRNSDFIQATQAELDRRSVMPQVCDQLIQEEDTRNAVAALAVIAIVGAAAVAANSSGAGYASPSTSSAYSSTSDYDWAWDQFYGASYELVWACRGIQTGQFANVDKCQYDPKIDSRWPAK
jgi:hypothetical protein